jgi:hypothetical protein
MLEPAKKWILLGLTLGFFSDAAPALSQPRTLVIGVEIVDQVEPAGMPPHLQRVKPLLLDNLHQDLMVLFADLGRCKPLDLAVDRSNGSRAGSGAVDFFAQVIVHQLHKSYRNKQYVGTSHDIHIADELYYEPGETEVTSEPILIARLEFGLVDAHKGKRFWSRMSDSTAAIPHGRYDYIFNPAKHPGAVLPESLQNFMADILRLTDVPRSPLRYILDAADRWFISKPQDDIDTAQGLLAGMAASFYTHLDSNLPLEGQAVELLPEKKDKTRVLLNIGAEHGVIPHLKLDVWRPLPTAQKVGQIQVVQVDSTTAVARVRKIDKQLRKRGEGIQPGDRVISKKRKSTRSWSAGTKSRD